MHLHVCFTRIDLFNLVVKDSLRVYPLSFHSAFGTDELPHETVMWVARSKIYSTCCAHKIAHKTVFLRNLTIFRQIVVHWYECSNQLEPNHYQTKASYGSF